MQKDKGTEIIAIARYVIAELHKSGQLKGYEFGDDDIQGVAFLAGVEAFKRWDESKGKLTTFIVPRIRGAIVDYVNKEVSRGMGGKRAKVCVISLDSDDQTAASDGGDSMFEDGGDSPSFTDSFTYRDTVFGSVPEGFDEPEKEQNRCDLRGILNSLGEPCQSLLVSYYGLDGEQPSTLGELEVLTGVKVSTNYARLKSCLDVVKNRITGDIKNVNM